MALRRTTAVDPDPTRNVMILHDHVLVLSSLSLLALTGSSTVPQGATRVPGKVVDATVEELEAARPVPVLRVDLPGQDVVALDGHVESIEPHELWRPVCAGTRAVTPEELAAMVEGHRALRGRPTTVVDTQSRIGSFNLVFVASGSIPAGASAALAASEAYIESFYSDPITITINISFQPLGPGILGGTGSSYGSVSYATARAQLVGDMDASDTLQASLPSGTTCPVRYSSGSTVTNENRVFFTFANWKAADGVVSGADANMTFSTNFSFDYDPTNGITTNFYSFQDVVIHEVGHAMGFTSGGDFRVNDMEVLDLFRFQRTDGTGDYNPDTTAEFQVRARLVAFNAPNDNHNSDLISVEYRMSDGSPYQMSHFREQSANIGLMDPALAPGQTFYPAFYSTADVTMFDVIGYDR